MGVKVAGTVKSHHTKNKKQNLVFDLNRLNKMKTAPILNGFFQQRCLKNKQRNKKAYSLKIISKVESVNLVFNTKRPVHWLIPLSCFLLNYVPQWFEVSHCIFITHKWNHFINCEPDNGKHVPRWCFKQGKI